MLPAINIPVGPPLSGVGGNGHCGGGPGVPLINGDVRRAQPRAV
jgi:hypothetical protein